MCRTLFRVCLWMLMLGTPVFAQAPTPQAIPAGRFAENLAIIPISGERLDWVDAVSVRRRIDEAARGGAQALVFRIDASGGDLGAISEITGAIRASAVPSTAAWVSPRARGGAALVALACRHVLVAPGATIGGAGSGASTLGLHEGTDVGSPRAYAMLLSDAVNSARRHGRDEMLVQTLVVPGAELWLVRHARTGQSMLVSEREYRLLFGLAPPRGTPILSAELIPAERSAQGIGGSGPGRRGVPGATLPTGSPGASTPSTSHFLPASPTLAPAVVSEVDAALTAPSSRAVLSLADRGEWTLVGYACDGRGLALLNETSAKRMGLADASAGDLDAVRAYFGATNTVTLRASWHEVLAQWLGHPLVRAGLIVIFLVALFVEFTHPGAAVPGSVAALALVLLVGPRLLIGLSPWWAPAGIVLGIGLLALEVFVLPSFGVLGVVGLLALLGGLVGTFSSAGAGAIFPGAQTDTGELWIGLTMVVLSVLVAIGLAAVMLRFLPGLPLMQRLVLRSPGYDDEETPVEPVGLEPDLPALGATGVAVTPLRPAGRAEIAGRMVDVVAEEGFVPAGSRVRVVEVSEFKITVRLDVA